MGPGGAGSWPAFWMQRADYADSADIDVMEVLGRHSNTLHMHYHTPTRKVGGSYTTSSSLSGGWPHACARLLVWYLDGLPRLAHTGSDVDSHAHYVMFNLSIGGSRSWGGAPDGSTQLPSMRVDRVRVWQRS